MTKHEWASFALKLLGLYTVIESLPLLQPLTELTALPAGTAKASVLHGWMLAGFGLFLLFVLMVLVGLLLFRYSRELAPHLVGQDHPLHESSTLTGRDVQAIGFSIVGVLIFLRALPGFYHAVWRWLDMITSRVAEPYRSAPRVLWPDFLPAALQLALALVLFFQARGLANFWHRIQAGKDKKIK